MTVHCAGLRKWLPADSCCPLGHLGHQLFQHLRMTRDPLEGPCQRRRGGLVPGGQQGKGFVADLAARHGGAVVGCCAGRSTARRCDARTTRVLTGAGDEVVHQGLIGPAVVGQPLPRPPAARRERGVGTSASLEPRVTHFGSSSRRRCNSAPSAPNTARRITLSVIRIIGSSVANSVPSGGRPSRAWSPLRRCARRR